MIQIERYLTEGNRHWRPLAALTAVKSHQLACYIEKESLKYAHCGGYALHGAAHALLWTAPLLTIPLALIEGVAATALGILALIFDKFAHNHRSITFLQKHSLICSSYGIHSLLTAVCSLVFLWKYPGSKTASHKPYLFIDQGNHFVSACLVQLIVGGAYLDPQARRSQQFTLHRLSSLWQESREELLHSGIQAVDALRNDRQFNLQENVVYLWNAIVDSRPFRQYLNSSPQLQQLLRNFDIRNFDAERVLEDRAYYDQLVQVIVTFINFIPSFIQNRASGDVTLSPYRQLLKGHIKDAFLEIYRTPELSRCLDQGGSTGRDLLVSADATIFLPLANYAQYKELLAEIRCPTSFSGPLRRYNQRQEQLIQAKTQLTPLSPVLRAMLVEKILRGSDFVPPAHLSQQDLAQINALFLAIGRLAEPLVQGPLIREANGNLFQMAIQEAMATVGSTAV